MTETQRQAAAEWIEILRKGPAPSSSMGVSRPMRSYILSGLRTLGAPLVFCRVTYEWALVDKGWRYPPRAWSRADLLDEVKRLRPDLHPPDFHPLNIALDRMLGPLP